MTWALEFETAQEAMNRSFQEAAAQIGEKHTTEYWWGWIEHNGKFYLLCDETTPGAIQMELT